MIECQNVSKYYDNQRVIDNVSFNIQKGEFVVIMGPSGSGKTTLLHLMAGIDRQSNGTIIFQNKNFYDYSTKELDQLRQKAMGFIFQEYNILPTLTCRENIALPLTIQRYKREEIATLINEYAENLAISPILDTFPHAVSGGEKQRVAVARALITKPEVVFADEPTGALDSKSAYNLLTQLDIQNKINGQTIVMVTHDAFSASFAERILFIKDGKIFHTLARGDVSRKVFFEQIIQVTTMLGGEFNVI
jgi:ABC-type antimicrobial peptide transport system, ATPase component